MLSCADAVEISTLGLDEIVEHNVGDLTAVLDAGVKLADAQAAFAAEGQMLALDPPDLGATIGGVIATADSGPLRHRYGSVRDLVVGMTVALSDGTVAKSGGKVIKNVAGYDLAKLFTGAYGTLGAILQVAVRLHPLAPATVTAVGRSDDPRAVAAAASALTHARLELECLDVRWEDGSGAVMARSGGAAAAEAAEHVSGLLAAEGLESSVEDDDGALWDAQRDAQRAADGTVVRVSGPPGPDGPAAGARARAGRPRGRPRRLRPVVGHRVRARVRRACARRALPLPLRGAGRPRRPGRLGPARPGRGDAGRARARALRSRRGAAPRG